MSSLYLRGNSVWIDYADRFQIRRRMATGFALDRVDRRSGRIQWPRDVLEWQKEFDRRLVYHKWDFNPQQTAGHPLSLILKEYLENEGGSRKPATRYLYESAWKLLIEHFGDVPIEQIGQDDVSAFRRWLLSKSGSDHTASKKFRSIGAIFSWAEARQIVQRSPITRLHAIQTKGHAVQTFTPKEIEKILKASPPPARDLFRFLVLTGFRLGEACALQWKDVDLKARVIRVFNIKEDRWEYFPIDPELGRLLRSLSREHEPFVFKYRSTNAVSVRFGRIRRRLKLPDRLRLHSLRANFVSSLVNSGLSESQVMQLARHRSLATTHKYYTAFDQKGLREALRRSRYLR